MARYQPTGPISVAITRPPCSMCGSRMLLARIEPEKPGYEIRTFECPTCEHTKSVVTKI